MDFQSQLQKLRKGKGMSQEDLAEKLGVSRQTVSKWEGGTAYPDMLNLMTISSFFDITIDALIKGEEKSDEEDKSPLQNDARRDYHYEHKSKITIKGVPLLHINFGIGNYHAKGIFAIGNVSTGVFSLGIIAKGVVTLGVLSLGLFAFGVLSIGLFALGCIAVGLIAIAGMAIGVMTLGGLAIVVVSIGGCALATHIAVGGYAAAPLAIGYIAKGEDTLLILQIGNITDITAANIRALAAEKFPNMPEIFIWWATLLFK